MRRSVIKIPAFRFSIGLIILFTIIAVSCGQTPPTSDQTMPEVEPTASSGLVAVAPSAPQLSPGQHLRFERISLEQGLSQSTVFTMLQDSQGFMWFGTEDGLNKYDGYTFTVYKHDPENDNSLSDDWIAAMLEDRSGIFWIGTREGGLVRYDRKTDQFTHYRNDAEDPSSLSDDRITAILQDQDGVLWIGTGGGLNRFDQANDRFINYPNNPDNPNSLSSNAVSAIYEDKGGALWIGTEDGGLIKFERENERWWHYQNDPSDPHSLSHNTITAISEDRSGAIWVGTGGRGLERLDPLKDRFTHYQHDPADPQSLSSDDISALYQDRDGALWIGTRSTGVNILDPEKGTFHHYQNVPGDPYSLSSNLVLSIFQDREGVLWVGSTGGGVNKLGVGSRNFTHYKNDPNNPRSLGDNMIRAFYQDSNGALWIGTMFGGVDRFDRTTGDWRHYQYDPDDPGSLSNNFVSVIYKDRADVLWIGTASGLDRFNPGTEIFTHYKPNPNGPSGTPSNNVRTINESQDGEFWIGTKGGLYRFNLEENHWSQFYYFDPDDSHNLGTAWVFAFLEDREGRIWIGTLGEGIFSIDPETDVVTHYHNDPGDPTSLSNNLISRVFQDREGVLWFSTPGGLNRLDPATETFTHYREKDGLPNDSINCLLGGNQGRLWLSTNQGMSRFDPQSETFQNYDLTDGLQSNEFNGNACYVSESGEMFFGGIEGFNTFFPDQVQDNRSIPPIVLTSLVLGSEEVHLESAVDGMAEVTLEWPDNSLEFEFAALSFSHPDKNQYAYYLDGFEETWNEVGTRRYGQYTNLPGGTYTLRVKGSNNDGIWNDVGTSVPITIVPPFWATWWFRGIILLALAGSIYGGYRLRLRNLEAQSRKLETQVVNRTRALAAINAVANVASHSLDLERVLSNALDKTLEVMEMEAGGIYLLRQVDQVLTIAAYNGLGTQFVAEIDNLNVGEGFSGQVVQTGEPLVVQDLSKDPRLTRSAVKDSGFQSLAIAPLVSRAKVLGTLFAITSRDREFSQQDIELLISIGGQIGVAVENAQLYEQAKRMAVVEERQRLARELHDSVTQSLHSSTLLAEAGQRLASRGDLERTRGYLIRLGEITQQALKEMRLLVYELRPLHLMNVGLVGALQQRLDAVERRAGVDVNLVVDGEIELSPDVEETLFRIAQEALNNTLKHAAPSSIMVTIHIEGESPYRQVELDIIDDGRGFDLAALGDEGGLGLVGMRQRMENVGGVLDIQSTPGEGTQVKASVDLGTSTDSPEAREVDA
jgi:signal transduction histidine kinase/ligand-binding sensor domain-containing protein